jgi:phospholipase C
VSLPYEAFLLAAELGLLPSVSFVDPNYTLLDDGSGNDDHPHADLRNGEAFVKQVFDAVSKGPNWASTVLIINRDEWGGFFEHVKPTSLLNSLELRFSCEDV